MEQPDEAPTTQKTPEGLEIPIPQRDAVLRDLMKLAPKSKPTSDKDPDKRP